MFSLKSEREFRRARVRAMFSKIFSVLKSDDLLPLTEVSSLIKPSAQAYRGIQSVPISLIVGSEGRYRDFNKRFFPRFLHLRSRWESINRAHDRGVTLPPVQLYEIGGVYFVRDGNHRVSVALQRGQEFIDAEVTTLHTDLKLDETMSMEDLRREVIEYEKKRFFEITKLRRYRPDAALEFTAPGRFDEAYKHILGHKYYMNLDKEKELPLKDAVISWYDNVYHPIIDIIEAEKVISRFPGRTVSDLYIWIVHYWDDLKRRYGNQYSSHRAVLKFSKAFGKNFVGVIAEKLRHLFRKR